MSILAAYCVPHPPLIIESVGRGEEQKIASTIRAYKAVAREIADLAPDTIILTTPHLTMYQDYFHISPGRGAQGDLKSFGAPSSRLSVRYDEEFIRQVSLDLARDSFPAGTQGERSRELDHASYVPLHFILAAYADFQVVRIGLSGLSLARHYELGMYLARTARELERRCVFVASGDLSHRLLAEGPYGFDPQGPVYDETVMAALGRADFKAVLTMPQELCEAAGECGHRSFAILAGSLDRTAVEAEILSYEGPFGVGYGVVAFHPKGDASGRNFLDQVEAEAASRAAAAQAKASPPVRLAFAVIRAHLEHRHFSLADYEKTEELPDFLTREASGVFVSLKKDGQLRGCIGTIAPTTPSIAEEIERNAVEAAFHDPRFAPLDQSEFPALIVSVDILSPAEAVASEADLDPSRYGVIVTHGRRRGLLLPDLPGVDTVAEQVAIARSKAGIRPEEDCSLERFKVVRYE